MRRKSDQLISARGTAGLPASLQRISLDDGFGIVLETPQQQSDREMIAKVARGEGAAFRALYDRLSGPLYSLALKMLNDAGEAEDALQDVFVQIWSRAKTYDPEQSSVFTWTVLLTRSRVVDRLRARGRRLRVVTASTNEEEPQAADASTVASAADIVDKNEEVGRVRSKLNELPSEQREAIELAFFTDLTHHEIAVRLGQPLGTVKARIRRGLLKLRERLTI
jgi:RNA polymerase sigma-70 factor, ECF subfamily